jgi:hypothetical protein
MKCNVVRSIEAQQEIEMTTIASVPETRSFFEVAHAAVQAFVDEVNAVRARRAERIALRSLLEMDPSRLYDLGIDAIDVREALASPHNASGTLAAVRAENANRI